MTPRYTVDYFIQKFEAIPEEKWITGRLRDAENRCCAVGHCCWSFPNGTISALMDILPSAMIINDFETPNYPQPTPKARILAALRDIQKKQEKA